MSMVPYIDVVAIGRLTNIVPHSDQRAQQATWSAGEL